MDWGAGNVPYFDLRIAEKAIRMHRTIFLCVCGGGYMGSYFPYQGSNLHPLHWNGGILTPGPPAKS